MAIKESLEEKFGDVLRNLEEENGRPLTDVEIKNYREVYNYAVSATHVAIATTISQANRGNGKDGHFYSLPDNVGRGLQEYFGSEDRKTGFSE
jgi:hypothetical protein